jgi:hypothetical protein
MQVPGTSGSYGDSSLQSLLALLQSQAADSAGQYSPSGSSSTSTSSSSTTVAASTPTSSSASTQFATDTLSALLQAQGGQTNTATQIADQVINTLNPGGTSLSLSQVETALTGSSASSSANTALAAAFSQLDTNGDGQLSASELARGVENLAQDQSTQGASGHHHHHHHGGAPSSTDASSSSASSSASTSSDTSIAETATTATTS